MIVFIHPQLRMNGKKIVFMVLIVPSIFAACSPNDRGGTVGRDTVQQDESAIVVDLRKVTHGSTEGSPVSASQGAAAYQSYTEGVIGSGEPIVPFFAASWCPACKEHDTLLRDWYSSGDVLVSTYKIDYDTASDLRSRYGVVQQDTFVRIDERGDVLQVISFSDEVSLRNLISG